MIVYSLFLRLSFVLCLGTSFGFCARIENHPNWYLFDHDNCGASISDRIIGGTKASLGQFPWLARIGYVNKNHKITANFRCGGALINQMYVLTAAHCITPLPVGFIVDVIRLGENNARMNRDCEGFVCAEDVQDFRPAKLVVHKDYGNPPYRNDIALVRLNRPAILNGWVHPICLPTAEIGARNKIGDNAIVAGWGVYNISIQQTSDDLLYVNLPIVELQSCVNRFEEYATIGKGQMCVGGMIGRDSCGGDSGGPLMYVASIFGPPKVYVLGIVSFGARKCGSTTMPAVYTDVTVYLKWILDNITP